MKVEGKDLEFWYDGVEIPVISIGESEVFDTLDSTDSSTPGDGKDFEVGRAARSFSVEALLRQANGAELIAAAVLVVGNTYQVTDVGTNLTAYEVGQIFTAETAITLAGDDKVKPLGAPITGKTMSFTFDAVDVPLTAADISIKYDSLDVTDTDTTGDGSETIVSRADRESKITGIVRSEAADLLTTDPTPEAATLEFLTGHDAAGTIIPVGQEISDEVNGYAKVDYTFKWKGAPTETGLGLVCGVAKAFKLILKRGASTNKEYTGTCIITEKTISSEVKGLTKVSYSISINGAVTYAVAN